MPETDEEYQAYLRERFGKESTFPDPVKRVVQDIVGSPLASSQRLLGGESNEVHYVRTKGGKEAIVRISRKGPLGFQREKWAIEQCRKVGVPVPRILGIESLPHKEGTLCVCVEGNLRGQSLACLLVKQGPEGLRPLIIKAGGELSKIHSIKTQGYGRLDAFGQGERATWAEVMLEEVEEKAAALRVAAQKIGLEPEAIDKGLEILNQHHRIYADISPCLLHGDFDPVHILIENQKITGIIDFENCCSCASWET